MSTSFVSIIGAGPGDPELITVKALKRIQTADVILYDRLVNDQLLAEAPEDALRIYCGKAPGLHSMSQEMIGRMLITHAAEGKRVVRLKGGDPFIFGRGGEEALVLAQAGIAFEVIPGITSAVGTSASTLIPLTHRGLASSFACVTGTGSDGNVSSVRWDLLAHSVDTLVIYMGISQLADIQRELLRHGKPSSTPAALVERGTTSQERIIAGTLAELQSLAVSERVNNPALIIIGEAVRVREQLLQLQRAADASMTG
ncbi:uroporphyrinogen-III C-methyltransferase [Paenibacillus sp. ACRSA]|uniref:uroporphyrinogen-III C-methyltransferase n=1 Tax=Paenibacillus sp. ACRSA TaxID=2918211 RepID=UPI001EF47C2C|nr:uroporphyrinogen-III C-methyltransferase [Paenibacillus sp. ACRSA]MCG7378247.1 uroporphyrinogen-III C-methyltransferase [Paenibacillus sp. ACRSA]